MIESPPGDVASETEALLRRRRHPQWESLSWIALRPLISSLNQVLATQAPALVPALRTAWVRDVPPTSDDLARSREVDRSDDTSFVLLGDTGEQDRSQYVVAPVLRRVVAERDPAFAVICSDVIYPSGDVNDYDLGFYLPYGPAPDGSSTDGEPLARLPVYALPGNHDWHDALSGFMQQFCATAPLDPVRLRWPSPDEVPGPADRLREGLVRMLWRRPGLPRTPVEAQRRRRVAPGQEPVTQPGPYFSVRMRDVLLVAIDTGVGLGAGDAVLDPEQSRWFLAVSALPGPKVLLTGNPLLVNGERTTTRLDLPGAPGTPTSVGEVVADPAHGYVAAVGGDLHNYQQYRDPRPDGPAVHHLVSGGGGAYMSATHPVQVARAVSPEHHRDPYPERMIPAPAESLSFYASRLLPMLWRLERGLGAIVAGVAAGALLATGLGASGGDPPPALGAWLASGVGVLAVLLGVRALVPTTVLRSSPATVRVHRAAVVAAAGLTGVDIALCTAWAAGGHWRRYLAGWAVLTTAGAIIGKHLRDTGWWRDPVPGEGPLPLPLRIEVAVTSTLSVLVAVAFGHGSPDVTARWVPPVTTLAVVLAALASWRWWRRKVSAADARWRSYAPPVAYAVQAAAAVALLSSGVFVDRPWLPWAVPAGLAALAVLTAGSLALGALTLRLLCTGPGWRDRWGTLGHLGARAVWTWLGALLAGWCTLDAIGATHGTTALALTWSAPFAVLALAAGSRATVGGPVTPWVLTATAVAATLVSFAGAVAAAASAPDAARAAGRASLVTAVAVAATVGLVFAVDHLRRRHRGLAYKLPAMGVVLAAAVALAGADRLQPGVLAGAGSAVAVTLLLVVTVTIAHLMFLGAQRLVTDRDTHRDGVDLVPVPAAELILDWRRHHGDAPVDERILHRALMVAPSTDTPRGPIQEKVSEIVDSDHAPFWKNFLHVATTPEALTIDVYVVRGLGTVTAEATPDPTPVVVPLGDAPPTGLRSADLRPTDLRPTDRPPTGPVQSGR